ncbi:hypothetical protein JCM14469_05070 [Desulfatiferula olefinivorans]
MYGGGEGLTIDPARRMDEGDTCNAERWRLPNHFGTHLDFPRHFARRGRTADDYDAGWFVFNRVGLIDLGPVEERTLISWEHVGRHVIPADIEALIVKTGFSSRRNATEYRQANPGFDAGLADSLRERFPSLRLLGFDVISLSSFAFREAGRVAHRRFLDHPRPILPLEDMALEGISANVHIRQMIVAPLRVSGTDAAPCTVMAEVSDDL